MDCHLQRVSELPSRHRQSAHSQQRGGAFRPCNCRRSHDHRYEWSDVDVAVVTTAEGKGEHLMRISLVFAIATSTLPTAALAQGRLDHLLCYQVRDPLQLEAVL